MINFRNLEDAQRLAEAIVNTIHDPLLVLDQHLAVMAASRSFYETFAVDAVPMMLPTVAPCPMDRAIQW